MDTWLTTEQKAEVIASLQRYFSEEFDYDLRDMPAGFFVDYLMKEVAPFAYNAGVADAQKYFLQKTEDLTGTCFEEGLTHWKKSSSSSKWVRRKS